MEEFNPLKNNFDNSSIKNKRNHLFEITEEINITKEKNELKLSLRKKHNNEIAVKISTHKRQGARKFIRT